MSDEKLTGKTNANIFESEAQFPTDICGTKQT